MACCFSVKISKTKSLPVRVFRKTCKFKSKLANINKLKSYPVSRINIDQSIYKLINIDSHKNHREYYKEDYIKQSCRLASLESFQFEETGDSF